MDNLSKYELPSVAVDVVALTVDDNRLKALLIKRASEPFAGHWALPGTLLRSDETIENAATRVLGTKASVSGYVEQLGSFGDPGRDPRRRVVSVAYVAFLPPTTKPEAGVGASEARWVDVDASGPVVSVLTIDPLAFDHDKILSAGVERARSKLEWTPLAASFIEHPFTIPELRGVYEAVWGQPLDAPNFHRKVLTTPGFLVPAKGTRGRAQLFTQGDAIALDPPINRLTTSRRRKEVVGRI